MEDDFSDSDTDCKHELDEINIVTNEYCLTKIPFRSQFGAESWNNSIHMLFSSSDELKTEIRHKLSTMTTSQIIGNFAKNSIKNKILLDTYDSPSILDNLTKYLNEFLSRLCYYDELNFGDMYPSENMYKVNLKTLKRNSDSDSDEFWSILKSVGSKFVSDPDLDWYISSTNNRTCVQIMRLYGNDASMYDIEKFIKILSLILLSDSQIIKVGNVYSDVKWNNRSKNATIGCFIQSGHNWMVGIKCNGVNYLYDGEGKIVKYDWMNLLNYYFTTIHTDPDKCKIIVGRIKPDDTVDKLKCLLNTLPLLATTKDPEELRMLTNSINNCDPNILKNILNNTIDIKSIMSEYHESIPKITEIQNALYDECVKDDLPYILYETQYHEIVDGNLQPVKIPEYMKMKYSLPPPATSLNVRLYPIFLTNIE